MNKNGTDVSPCKTSVTMLKKSVSPSGEWTIAFLFLWSIIITVTVSLGKSYVKSICSISSVYQIKCLGEIYKECYLEIFCSYSFDHLTNSQNLRNWGLIFSKTILTFPKNFLRRILITWMLLKMLIKDALPFLDNLFSVGQWHHTNILLFSHWSIQCSRMNQAQVHNFGQMLFLE